MVICETCEHVIAHDQFELHRTKYHSKGRHNRESQDAAIQNILNALISHHPVADRPDMLKYVCPPTEYEPLDEIHGLPLFDGFLCAIPGCSFITKVAVGLKAHFKSEHNGSILVGDDMYTKCLIQNLFTAKHQSLRRKHFRVQARENIPVPPNNEARNWINQAVQSACTNSMLHNIPEIPNELTVQHSLGWINIVQDLNVNKKAILEKVFYLTHSWFDIPSPAEALAVADLKWNIDAQLNPGFLFQISPEFCSKLFRLKVAAIRLVKVSYDRIGYAPNLCTMLMQFDKDNVGQGRNAFKKLQTEQSAARYRKTFVKLVLFLYYVRWSDEENERNAIDSLFPTLQLKVLHPSSDLNMVLSSEDTTEEQIEKATVSMLVELLKWRGTLQEAISDDLVHMYIFSTSYHSKDGKFHAPNRIAQKVARLKYIFRMVALMRMEKLRPTELVEDAAILQFNTDTCHLFSPTDGSIVFQNLRSTMNLARKFQSNEGNLPTVHWKDESRSVAIAESTVEVTEQTLKMFFARILAELKVRSSKFVSGVVPAYDLVKFPLVDKLDETRSGYSVFEDGNNFKFRSYRESVISDILERNLVYDGGVPTVQSCQKLINTIFKFLDLMTVAIFCFTAQTGRGTEIAPLKFINTPNEKRNLFLLGSGYFALVPQYHKGFWNTGLTQKIVRFNLQ